MNPVQKVMKRAKINKESIDDLFLVGGSTFMKKIRKLLFDTTNKVPCQIVDSREAVAFGACIKGLWTKNRNHQKFNNFIDVKL